MVLPAPGEVHRCSKVSPIVGDDSDCGSLESQSLRNGSVTFPRLMSMTLFLGSSDCNMIFEIFELHFVRQLLFQGRLDPAGLAETRPGCDFPKKCG